LELIHRLPANDHLKGHVPVSSNLLVTRYVVDLAERGHSIIGATRGCSYLILYAHLIEERSGRRRREEGEEREEGDRE
jgi:hypothetical protein